MGHSSPAIAGGVTISALVFGVGHADQPDNPLFFLTWILAGVVLGGLYVPSGSLWLTIGVHAAFNVAYQSVFVRTGVMPEGFRPSPESIRMPSRHSSNLVVS